MTHSVSVEQAAAHLPDLIHSLKAYGEILITQNNMPVASLRPNAKPRRRQAGSGKGMLTMIKEDEDHLQDFREYMP